MKHTPTDGNSMFTTLYSIEQQLKQTDVSTAMIEALEKQAESLLAQFQFVKSQLDSSTRLELRERFLRLATKQSNRLDTTAMALANSSHMLPERMINRHNQYGIGIEYEMRCLSFILDRF
jgi:hypothetical protein